MFRFRRMTTNRKARLAFTSAIALHLVTSWEPRHRRARWLTSEGPPAALITKMSLRPSGRESNAICWPSGDQRGVPVCGPLNDVSCTGFEPSSRAAHISQLPERSDWKASLLPSGDTCGAVAVSLEEVRRSEELIWLPG